jgi:hypothetical protein
MSVWANDIDSSNIERVGYCDKTHILRVVFWSGSIYDYYHVPWAVYNEMSSASSVGSYFHRNVRHSYTSKKVKHGDDYPFADSGFDFPPDEQKSDDDEFMDEHKEKVVFGLGTGDYLVRYFTNLVVSKDKIFEYINMAHKDKKDIQVFGIGAEVINWYVAENDE